MMIRKDKKLFQRSGPVQDFLVSKTDTGRLKGVERKVLDGINGLLKSSFPDMLAGSHFINQAMQRLDSIAQFTATVIRTDQAQTDHENYSNLDNTDTQIEVAGIVQAVCRRENGLWGVLEHELIGCFFPEKNGLESLNIVHRIQMNLTEKTGQTATIGVAVYPTITFKKSEIMDNARKALDHACFFGPGSAVAFDDVSLNISGDKLYEKGKIQAAVDEFKKAISMEPSNVNVHNSLGVCYGLQGHYKRAIEEFRTAVSLNPQEYMALYNLGLVHVLMNQRNQALEFFLSANQVDGNVYEIAFQTGKLYVELGDPKKSRPFLEHAAKLKPESSAVFRYLGECHTADHMPQAAISAYKQALKKNPNDAASMSALGFLFDVQGENREIALMFCRESVELAPDNGLFRYRLGRLYANQNQPDEALEEFIKAKALGYDTTKDIQEIKNRKKVVQ